MLWDKSSNFSLACDVYPVFEFVCGNSAVTEVKSS